MLCQFSVKNYKSFKDEATLDFQATNITDHENEIIVDNNDGAKYLPLASIYGPNGSGKSNVLSALNSLLVKIMRPICAACDKNDCSEKNKKKPNIVPFRFDIISINEPTEFEIFFRSKKAEYKYVLHVKEDIVIYESLSKLNFNSSKEIKLFYKDTNLSKQIWLNKTYFKNINVSGISESLPILSYLGITNKDIDVIKDVLRWLEGGIETVNYGNPYTEARILLIKGNFKKEMLIKMLKEADIDIDGYRTEEKDEEIKVFTKHIVDDYEQELSLADESNGTVKLFALLPMIIDSIKRGTTLVVDELDAKLHPKLLEYIIELYRNPSKNKKGAQLVFTSHDLMTMTAELFRRDEIWFVAKNNEQASKLYSLVEFKKENGKAPRKDEKYGKQYLEGRYGADPYFKRMINWEDQNGGEES